MLPPCPGAGLLRRFAIAPFRLTLGAVAFPSLLYAWLVASLPESPRFLLRRRQDRAAGTALQSLRGRSDVAVELDALKSAVNREADAEASSSSSSSSSSGAQTVPRGPGGGPSGATGEGRSWAALLEPRVARRLAVCVSLQVAQQFAGINAVVYFTPQILKASGTVSRVAEAGRAVVGPALSDDAAAILATAVAYCPKIPAMFLCMALMDSWGRKKLMTTFVPAMGACLLLLANTLGNAAPYASALSLAAISLYGVAFGLSLGPIPNIYTAESFPNRVRSAAMTVSLCSQFAAHAAVSFYFPTLMATKGPKLVFSAFAAVCAAAWLFVQVAVDETKQLSLEDTAAQLE